LSSKSRIGLCIWCSSKVLLTLAKKQPKAYLKLVLSATCGFGSKECKYRVKGCFRRQSGNIKFCKSCGETGDLISRISFFMLEWGGYYSAMFWSTSSDWHIKCMKFSFLTRKRSQSTGKHRMAFKIGVLVGHFWCCEPSQFKYARNK
jgi:hypothetical protein